VLLEVVVGLVILVGLVGIVIPVLPGSILILLAILGWAAVTGTPTAWLVFAVCAVLIAAAAAITWYLQAKHTRAAGVPASSLVVAGLAGIVGFFVIPAIGLLLFFPLGLFLTEYLRLRDPRRAWASALVALKATGLGIIGELALALTAAGIWLVAVVGGV
jgi:uncharacterized protein YqgC (DUF456 family)